LKKCIEFSKEKIRNIMKRPEFSDIEKVFRDDTLRSKLIKESKFNEK
jgi:hypothetical protein